MKIKISSWFGRFGNNIIQLSNACGYALENNYLFESTDHIMIKPFIINGSNNGSIYKNLFFYGFDRYDSERHAIVQKYIKPNLIEIPYFNISDNTLVIHIRSGDIFSNNPHNKYIQNPLNYFLSIIDNFQETIVLCEDDKNPVIDYLKKIKSVRVEHNDFLTDMSILLSTKNLCLSGVGTFGPICAMLSNHIKNLFITNIVNIDNQWIFNNNINVQYAYINLDRYIKPNSWKNTESQRLLMINYKM